MMQPTCQDCGTPVVTGVRCRLCNGQHIKMVYAVRMEEDDLALLSMVTADELTPGRLGLRLNITRVAADTRIKGARRRLALLEAAR